MSKSSLALFPLLVGALGLPGADATAQSQIQFTDSTAQSGVAFTHTDRLDTMAGGLCLFDYDRDGDPDLFVTARGGTTNRLFRNHGDGTFDDVTVAAGLTRINESTGAYAADLDADGNQDLIVLARLDTRIYRNRGDGTFEDVTTRSSFDRFRWAVSASFADYDHDGDLDIYIGNYIADGFFPYFEGYPNQLLRNDGNFTFVDVAQAAGVRGEERVWDPSWNNFIVKPGCTLSVLFFDYDMDGWADIFVGNDFGPFDVPNQLFHNDGNGHFTEVGATAGFRIAEFNMGLVTADVNGDGFPDLYTSNFGDNHLLMNDGRGRFRDVTAARNCLEGNGPGGPLVSWSAFFTDVDLDSLIDLYVSNGFVQAAMPNDPNAPSHLLHNLGVSFEVVPEPNMPWDRGVGRGAVCGDIDMDGDEDIIQLDNRQPLRIFRNDSVNQNHGAQLLLQGTLSNRDAIGSKLVIRSAQTQTMLEYQRGGSYSSCNAAPILRGIARDHQVESVDITWPSGVQSTVNGLAADARAQILEPKVTVEGLGAYLPIGTDYLALDVTVQNHTAVVQTTRFTARVVMGEQYFAMPVYYFPTNLGGSARIHTTVYLPLPAAALPIAAQMGLWLEIGTLDSAGGVDQMQKPLR
ncbi:MAG: CRTAC1 family protein [Planctomycetota bacterium]